MNDSTHPTDPDSDARLARLLNQAGNWQPPDAAESLARTRQTLLDRVGMSNSPQRPAGFFSRHRVAVASVAASFALVAALIGAFNWGGRLSAMERMAQELQKITSYSYRSVGTNSGIDDETKRKTTYKDDSVVFWSAPDACYEEMKIVKIVEPADGGKPTEETLARFDQVFSPGGSGVFIDHRYKTYAHILYEPYGSKMYPWDILRMVREGSYDVLADLGTKRIADVPAHGCRLKLKNPRNEAIMVHEPIDLWVDPKTDLPVEFGWSGESEGWKQADRVFDFRWNLAIDPKRFEPILPKDYDDITPPTEPADLDKIVDALRIYARLSGGHYPAMKKFTVAAVRDEMEKFADAPESDAARAEIQKQIDRAMPGLNWIGKIVRNRYTSGYRGSQVGPGDKEQVLLWWLMSGGAHYRVFYGDLRSEAVDEKRCLELAPEKNDVDYQKLE